LQLAVGASICKKATFKTNEEGAPNLTKTSTTLELHPIFTECKATIPPATNTATWTTTGCNLRFHAVKAGEFTGTMDIKCTAGHEIKVENGVPGCVYSVPSQSALGKVEYKNEPAGELTVNMELSKIKVKEAAACGIAQEFEGQYREGVEEPSGEVFLASPGHPAKFAANGKSGVEADPLEVAFNLNEPHWYENHVGLAEGGSAHVLMWGKWTFSSSSPDIGNGVCYTEWEGTVFNPGGVGPNAPPGEGKIEGFRADDCEDAPCEAKGSKLAVYPTNLGIEILPGSVVKREWEDKLATVAGKTTLKMGNKTEGSQRVGLTLYCEDIGKGGYKYLAKGELSPGWEGGTSIGSAPAKLLFGAGSGVLEIGPGVNVEFATNIKMMGYEAGEIISVKNP
jgi:hypothetical protein